MLEGHSQEHLQELRRILLLTIYKDTLNQLVLQQRSQRLNARNPISLPASLRRRRSSSMGGHEKQEHVLITGKVLPRLESLLGEPEDDADQLDEDVLNSLKFERDMDALRTIFEAAINDVELQEKKKFQDIKDEKTLEEKHEVEEAPLDVPEQQIDWQKQESLDDCHEIYKKKSKDEEEQDSAPEEDKDSKDGTKPSPSDDKSLEILKQAIYALAGNKSEVSQASQKLQESKDELKQLKEALDIEKRDTKAKLEDLEERIADTKYKLRCVSRVNDLEYSLVQRWEEGRLAQGTIWGENAERAYLRDILDIKQRIAREERVSCELRSFRQREIQDMTQQIEEWKKRYVSEMRRVEREAEAWELRILEQKKLLVRHREIFAERMSFVQEYRAQKAEEQRLHDLQVHRINCAVRLQAWWRGTMVRRGLGPFKKKPKRGKKGKPKK
ncbi:dynein regulatory complex protein 9 [Drosophila bipectinata]|uniref:dynein regulatory complex protein 9 n=1 Tax=Drosophila bipectinata TaxID=42026 RepID=UPI001C8AD1BF|nr:golgin subfamily A member 6-like protein 22 [Drosophila bipectinata]